MASEKQYAYYIEGNQICIVERDLTFDNNIESKEFGPGVSRQMWKSPIADIADGLELWYIVLISIGIFILLTLLCYWFGKFMSSGDRDWNY